MVKQRPGNESNGEVTQLLYSAFNQIPRVLIKTVTGAS